MTRVPLLIAFCLSHPVCEVKVADREAIGTYDGRDGRSLELRANTFCVIKTGGHEAMCRWQQGWMTDSCRERFVEFAGLLRRLMSGLGRTSSARAGDWSFNSNLPASGSSNANDLIGEISPRN